MSSWRLHAGKLRDAWLAYPTQRREIRQCAAGKPISIGGTHDGGIPWLPQLMVFFGLWSFNANKKTFA